LCVVGKFDGKELQCDVATKLEVLGLVNHPHPTATKQFEDAVMGDSLADHDDGC